MIYCLCSGEEMTADSSGRATGATMAGESTTASNIQEDSQSSNYFANNYRWGWKVAELQLVTSGVCFWVHITKILWLNDERKNVPMEGWLRGLRVMCLCSLSGGRIERSVGASRQEWRVTWDVGCCKHLQGHTTHTLWLWGHIKGKGFTSYWEKQGDKIVALYSIVGLRSFSWLLFCSARSWLRWRPALTRTQNFSWYVSLSTVYAVTLL